jgi:hypothetical protein
LWLRPWIPVQALPEEFERLQRSRREVKQRNRSNGSFDT